MRGQHEMRDVRQSTGDDSGSGSGAPGRPKMRKARGTVVHGHAVESATDTTPQTRGIGPGANSDVSRIAVGIDPGVSTGLALWDIDSQQFRSVATVTITEAMRSVQELHDAGHAVELRFEDARLRRAWYGGMDAKQSRYGAGVREGVGSVKRDCAIWQEFADLHGIPCRAISPQAKGAKVSAERFLALTGWPSRTSEHGRDAAMLVWGVQ